MYHFKHVEWWNYLLVRESHLQVYYELDWLETGKPAFGNQSDARKPGLEM